VCALCVLCECTAFIEYEKRAKLVSFVLEVTLLQIVPTTPTPKFVFRGMFSFYYFNLLYQAWGCVFSKSVIDNREFIRSKVCVIMS